MQVFISSFSPEQPGIFAHDLYLVLLLVPLPQVLEHLLHVLNVCQTDNDKMQAKRYTVAERFLYNNKLNKSSYTYHAANYRCKPRS